LAFSGREAEPDEHGRRGHVHSEILSVVRTGNMRKVAAATRQHLDDNEQIALGALDPIAP
jgi:DNA-binding GntR family transcriptional regulator